MYTSNHNLQMMALKEAIANKRYALQAMREAAYCKLKAATVKRLAEELRVLEQQMATR